jgi:hypothetical protein
MHHMHKYLPQPTFLHSCKKPSFTAVQNNRKNYTSIFAVSAFIFLDSKRQDERFWADW